MATLFERSTGIGLLDSEKMGIHSFSGALYEYFASQITEQQIVSVYSLTTAQRDQAIVLAVLINAAPNEALFMWALKNCLYIAESGDYYLTSPTRSVARPWSAGIGTIWALRR